MSDSAKQARNDIELVLELETGHVAAVEDDIGVFLASYP
jgi:hypothetical protein